MIAAINHQRALRINFMTFLSVTEKNGRFGEIILAVSDTL